MHVSERGGMVDVHMARMSLVRSSSLGSDFPLFGFA